MCILNYITRKSFGNNSNINVTIQTILSICIRTIHTLRQALATGLTEGLPYLGVERGAVYLTPELIATIDVEEFQKLYQEGHKLWSVNPTRAVEIFQEAKKLYRGRLFSEFPYEEWLFTSRENLQNQYLEILGRLAKNYTHKAEGNIALSLWKELLQLDPTNEYAVRAAMHLLNGLDRRNEALSLYKKLVKHLREDLDTVPEPQTEELHQNLLKKVRVG